MTEEAEVDEAGAARISREPESRGPRAAGRVRSRVLTFLPYPLILIAAIALWQLTVVVFDIPLYQMAAPSDLVKEFRDEPSVYLSATWWTGAESVVGFAVAAVAGILIAALLTYWRPIERVVMPYLVLLQVTPMVAIAPVLVMWFGFGFWPKVVTAFLSAVFPIAVNTAVGLRSADREVIDMLKVNAAPEWYVFWRARVPFALPHFLAGVKLAAPSAVIGAIVGEFVSSENGLGYLILSSQATLRTPQLFLAVVGSAFLGIATFGLAVWAERQFLGWHESQYDR